MIHICGSAARSSLRQNHGQETQRDRTLCRQMQLRDRFAVRISIRYPAADRILAPVQNPGGITVVDQAPERKF